MLFCRAAMVGIHVKVSWPTGNGHSDGGVLTKGDMKYLWNEFGPLKRINVSLNILWILCGGMDKGKRKY